MDNPLALTDPSGLNYCSSDSFVYDDNGNFIGYDESQCVTDEQYGDGSGYAGYIYVGSGDGTEVSTSLVPVNTVTVDVSVGSQYGPWGVG